MQQENLIEIVLAWQDAANHRDFARLLELSDPNIEVTGPRGSGHGHQLVREWLLRSGLTFKTLRLFAHGDVVVVEQHGVWHSAETGEPTSEADFASHFRIDGGRVAQIARYDTLDVALEKAGLDYTDEVSDKN
ncbi:MAG: nuclear transport factor 2 family protein [Chloroflexia bacterium]